MDASAIARRQVVLLPFPFSGLSASKLHPALVLADAERGDWLLCQITSQPYADDHAAQFSATDFTSGGLQRISYARPAKLFTAHDSLFTGIAGEINVSAHQRVCDGVVTLLMHTR